MSLKLGSLQRRCFRGLSLQISTSGVDNLNSSAVTLESSVLEEPASKKMKTGDSDSDTEVEDEDEHAETLESSVLEEPASKKMKTGDSDSDTEVEDEDDHEEGGRTRRSTVRIVIMLMMICTL